MAGATGRTLGVKAWMIKPDLNGVECHGVGRNVSKELCLLYSAARAGCTLGKFYRKNNNQYRPDSEIINRHVHLPLLPISRFSATFRSQNLN